MSKVDEVLQKYMNESGIVVEELKLDDKDQNSIDNVNRKRAANTDNDPDNDETMSKDEEGLSVVLGDVEKKEADQQKKNDNQTKSTTGKVKVMAAQKKI